MYINAFDLSNPNQMLNVEDKFIFFDLPLQTCRRTRDKMSIILDFPSVNEFFSDNVPYFCISRVYLTLDIAEGLFYVSYRRRIFHRFAHINPYAYHRVRCTNKELEAIIRIIYREDCKDHFFLKTTIPSCFALNQDIFSRN